MVFFNSSLFTLFEKEKLTQKKEDAKKINHSHKTKKGHLK
jgi:hypothetical protein